MTISETHLTWLPDFMLNAYNNLPEGDMKTQCDLCLAKPVFSVDEFVVLLGAIDAV